mmetsp:Transcript_5714/g.8388  ORF Transcript_5714/g.8388 Transcript_5714/m.8388 type:complete len:216 (-) Transcript_5714:82-729(-)
MDKRGREHPIAYQKDRLVLEDQMVYQMDHLAQEVQMVAVVQQEVPSCLVALVPDSSFEAAPSAVAVQEVVADRQHHQVEEAACDQEGGDRPFHQGEGGGQIHQGGEEEDPIRQGEGEDHPFRQEEEEDHPFRQGEENASCCFVAVHLHIHHREEGGGRPYHQEEDDASCCLVVARLHIRRREEGEGRRTSDLVFVEVPHHQEGGGAGDIHPERHT